jgi:hypothetical protein
LSYYHTSCGLKWYNKDRRRNPVKINARFWEIPRQARNDGRLRQHHGRTLLQRYACAATASGTDAIWVARRFNAGDMEVQIIRKNIIIILVNFLLFSLKSPVFFYGNEAN